MSIAPPSSLSLDDRFARELPELAVAWQAEEAPEPRLLVLNEQLAADLGLDPAAMRTPAGLELLLGTAVPEGAHPVAQAYAGHQFGGFVPRLGDGRALLLGEVTDTGGRLRDLALKGSGRTPFARGGDGLAAVGPMLREYVVSEAMHALGIPTTRSLAVVATGRPVRRETLLPGAVLTRVAAGHLRVGTFQYAAATGDADLLRRLADHAIARHHPAAAEEEQPYLALFEAVVAAQAALVAQWMLVGFVHGVMNTDNMTISGETIDYGPCAFMEAYDPDTVYSSIDAGGRYRYRNQPLAAEWNLARLAEALLPLLADDPEQAVPLAVEALKTFQPRYEAAWSAGMRAKLGLPEGLDDAVAAPLVDELLVQLQQSHVDHTTFFRALGSAARGDADPARNLFLDLPAIDGWLERWRALGPDPAAMDRVNPVYVPRNHLVEEALDAATVGDLDPLGRLLDAVGAPTTSGPASSATRRPLRRTSASTGPSAAPDAGTARCRSVRHRRNWPTIAMTARRTGCSRMRRNGGDQPAMATSSSHAGRAGGRQPPAGSRPPAAGRPRALRERRPGGSLTGGPADRLRACARGAGSAAGPCASARAPRARRSPRGRRSGR
ncbi:protein adenylyltransferase SelO [Blastococcus brunescens]|uniref:Protein nucleotidyltransferase YdiU n=1 Tax=Blastococcus brunescens TaxID=1564165 RepID=A0ABZ1B713_9ACTN|nr:YdiU family protein [Blastococcus sp. BMG 8361]WRL66594.1 YdiU family protein [Blastococcus sp. BMG 8361]